MIIYEIYLILFLYILFKEIKTSRNRKNLPSFCPSLVLIFHENIISPSLQMRKYSEVIANLNQTLQSEINRLSSEKSKSITGSEYSDYDLGEYGRLSSLLKLYSKKDTIEPLVEAVEELKSEVQLLSGRGDQLDALNSRSEYDKSRLNETIQVLKQVSNIFLYYL